METGYEHCSNPVDTTRQLGKYTAIHTCIENISPMQTKFKISIASLLPSAVSRNLGVVSTMHISGLIA